MYRFKSYGCVLLGLASLLQPVWAQEQAPLITDQPTNQIVVVGADANFSVTADGTAPLAFQWRFGGQPMEGATDSSLTITNAQLFHSGNYDVVVSNDYGGITSSVATLVFSPLVTFSPVFTVASIGEDVQFFGAATGSPPLAYQWRANGSAIPGATDTLLTVTNAQMVNQTSYSFLVSNAWGTVTSQWDVLRFKPTILAEPQDRIVGAGSNVTLAFTVAGSPALNYRWKLNGNTLGYTSTAIGLNPVTAASSGTYQFMTYNAWGAVTSRVVTLILLPTMTMSPSSQTALAGSNVVLTATATATPPFFYQWRKNGVPIAGATDTALAFQPAALSDTGSYDVLVTNAWGATNSSVALLNVGAPPPVIVTHPASHTVYAQTTATLTATVTGMPPLYYQWRKNSNPIAGATAGSLTFQPAVFSDTGTYDVVVSNAWGTATSYAALLNVVDASTTNIYTDHVAISPKVLWPSIYTLCVPAPRLSLSKSGGSFLASWPSIGTTWNSYSRIETATSLAPGATWSPVAVEKSLVGSTVVAPLSVTNDPQFFRLRSPCSMPLFSFAIYYNSLLEFTWAAPLTVSGPVYAAGDIYLGSAWSNVFNATVATCGQISSPAWDGHATNEYSVLPTFKGSIPVVTNIAPLLFPLDNSPTRLREMVNQPPPEGDTNTAISQMRYYNKAEIIMLVSNTTVSAKFQSAPSDPAPVMINASYGSNNFGGLVTNFPFLSLTNGSAVSSNQLTFWDAREARWALVTQIDMGRLRSWMATNNTLKTKFPAGGYIYPNIMYIADNRSYTVSQLPAVRLVNASIIPTNSGYGGQPTGFTIATPNPLYVKGDYNTPSVSNRFPASLVCDAITVLSTNWVDTNSSKALSMRLAANTTINAAIIAGKVSSTGPGTNTYSGGAMNFIRLLEDWSNGTSQKTLTMNTSLVCLFDSERATAQYRNPGYYYYAPARNFQFDTNFNDITQLPPGTPSLVLP